MKKPRPLPPPPPPALATAALLVRGAASRVLGGEPQERSGKTSTQNVDIVIDMWSFLGASGIPT